eukprot:367860-Prorocentrum_minimum.AAC.1
MWLIRLRPYNHLVDLRALDLAVFLPDDAIHVLVVYNLQHLTAPHTTSGGGQEGVSRGSIGGQAARDRRLRTTPPSDTPGRGSTRTCGARKQSAGGGLEG